MKHIPISQLQSGQVIESVYLIQGLDQRLKKNSEPYFFLTLQDFTGTITAMLWDNLALFLKGEIKVDDFILIKGEVHFYNDQNQITIKQYAKVPDSEIDLKAFQPYSKCDFDEMKAEFWNYVKSIEDEKINSLVQNTFSNEEIFKAFCECPSSTLLHQAYIGGLLEHTLGVIKNCLTLSVNYPKVNKDLLIAGAFFHDIGKIYEYSWRKTFQITDIGRLIGHIQLGAELVDKKIGEINEFDPKIKIQLIHMILSHHGILEYGSPKRPKTLEALILHFSDYIDAYLSTFIEVTERATQKGLNWSDYNKMFERFLFAGFNQPEKQE